MHIKPPDAGKLGNGVITPFSLMDDLPMVLNGKR